MALGSSQAYGVMGCVDVLSMELTLTLCFEIAHPLVSARDREAVHICSCLILLGFVTPMQPNSIFLCNPGNTTLLYNICTTSQDLIHSNLKQKLHLFKIGWIQDNDRYSANDFLPMAVCRMYFSLRL